MSTKIQGAKDLTGLYQAGVTGETSTVYMSGKELVVEQAETGKVVLTTGAGVEQVTPVADVVDFVVAVGDKISTVNGIITALAHAE